MWIWTANEYAKFHATWLNQSENIPKSFRGATFLKHPVFVQNVNFLPNPPGCYKI